MVHSFSLEHVNHMTAYRRRSFRVRENLHGSGAWDSPSFGKGVFLHFASRGAFREPRL